ncbi:hypothetical protein BDW72DRAFT_187830, partial [Aspergillus terricola var. indicus]
MFFGPTIPFSKTTSSQQPGFYSPPFLKTVFAQSNALSRLSWPPADLNVSSASGFPMVQEPSASQQISYTHLHFCALATYARGGQLRETSPKLMLTVTCVVSEPVLYVCAGAIQSNSGTDAVKRNSSCGELQPTACRRTKAGMLCKTNYLEG